MNQLDPSIYTVAWLAPLEIEARAALYMLDKQHRGRFPMSRGDDYVFLAGEMCGHNVIIAALPAGQEYGTGSSAALASQVKKFFPNLWISLLVGVAAGLPNLSRHPPLDIRLGDVLVGLDDGDTSAVVAYDLGKKVCDDGSQLLRIGHILAGTEPGLRSAIGSIKLQDMNDAASILPYYNQIMDKEHFSGTFIDPGQHNDTLYEIDDSGIERPVPRDRRPTSRRTRVWYGTIGSGEKLIKNAQQRNKLRDTYNIIGLEMEAVGIMNHLGAGVIRGVCDYGDEHRNKIWQPYAAAMAAAYAKAVLSEIRPNTSIQKQTQRGVLLDSLSFSQIISRHTPISADMQWTGQWLLETPEYLDWLSSSTTLKHNGFFWIEGPAGAGKSILLQVAINHAQKQINGPVLSFCFHAHGDILERSAIGMYRSLLWQLLGDFPMLLDQLDISEFVLPNGKLQEWSVELLEELFEQAVLKLGRMPLVCFIEELDLCDQSQIYGLIDSFEKVGRRARLKDIMFRVCLSSRQGPPPRCTVLREVTQAVEIEDTNGPHYFRYPASHLKIGLGLGKLVETGGSVEELNISEYGIDGAEGSDTDIESIFSSNSLPSSISSFAVTSIAVSEWAKLLRDDQELGQLYQIALAKVGEERFKRNFARFLKKYSQNLKNEASSEAHRQAVVFASQSARRTAAEVTQSLRGEPAELTQWSKVTELEKSRQINQWLESQNGHDDHAQESDNDDHYTCSEASDPGEDQFPSLDQIKDFMISASAFATLRQDLRSWLRVNEIDAEEVQGAEGTVGEASEEKAEPELAESFPATDSSIQGNGDDQSDRGKKDTAETAAHQPSPVPTGLTTASSGIEHSPRPLIRTAGTLMQRMGRVFGSWARLKAAMSPPAEGYERLFYTCSCGVITYFDVRETLPGGIERIKQRLHASQVEAGDETRHQTTTSDSTPCVPPPAHTRSARDLGEAGDTHAATPAAAAGPASAEAQEGTTAGTSEASDRTSRPQFLLLCVNAKKLTVLVQLEVGSLTSDGFLFREMRKAYERVSEDHAWRFSMFVPERLRNMILDPPQFLSRIFQAFTSIRLHSVDTGDFVKFQLVPVRDRVHPMWFRAPEFPPEEEVLEQRYIYSPVPIGVDIVNIPLFDLLGPGEHFDQFWLSMLPKKLDEELRRPAGTERPIIGWGIRVNETLNWAVFLLALFFVLLMVSVVVIVYSVATKDNSSAFGLGAYLAALLTVYLTYQYFAWKENM